MRGLKWGALVAVVFAFAARGDEMPSGSVYRLVEAVDAAVITFGAAGSLLPYNRVNAWVDPSCPCDPANVNSFDRRAIGNSNGFAGTLSDVTLGLALTLPPVLNWFDQGAGRTWVEDFVVYAESLAVSGLLVTVTKFAVQRPNPSVYATNDPGVLSDPNGYLSFYSGHAALAFSALSTAAVTSNLRYQTGILPWAFVLGLGSTIALGRVAAGDHFYTDIIVGALAGAAVGISVPLLHRRDERQWSLSLAPAPGRIEVLWRSALAF